MVSWFQGKNITVEGRGGKELLNLRHLGSGAHKTNETRMGKAPVIVSIVMPA